MECYPVVILLAALAMAGAEAPSADGPKPAA
jgi:hypothetical protein